MPGRRLIITDIHGCGTTFEYLTKQILQISPEDTLFLLGDYIDRGPTSKKVIDTILEFRANGIEVHTLRGNHEQLLLDSLKSPENYQLWMHNGGETTLDSFGIHSPRELDQKYLEFFQKTGFYIETPKSFLVHAGFNFDSEDIFSDQQAMIWIRNYKIDLKKLKNKKLIHGHTPTFLQDIKNAIKNDETEINLDNGCVYNHPLLNNLLCLNIDNMELIVQPNIEK